LSNCLLLIYHAFRKAVDKVGLTAKM